jgi:hypothetical protein
VQLENGRMVVFQRKVSYRLQTKRRYHIDGWIANRPGADGLECPAYESHKIELMLHSTREPAFSPEKVEVETKQGLNWA